MATPNRLTVVYGLLGWMTVTILVLTVFSTFTFDRFLIGTAIGILVVVGMTSSITVSPPWRVRLGRITTVALVAFAVVAVRRFVEIFPPELYPWWG